MPGHLRQPLVTLLTTTQFFPSDKVSFPLSCCTFLRHNQLCGFHVGGSGHQKALSWSNGQWLLLSFYKIEYHHYSFFAGLIDRHCLAFRTLLRFKMRTADYYCGDCIPRARTNVEGFATSSIWSWYIALDATLAQYTSSQSDSFNSSYCLMDNTLLAVALGFLTRKRNLLLVRKLFLLQSSDRRAIFFGWAVFRWTSKHKCFKAQTSAPEVPLSHVAMDYPVDAKPPEFRLIFEIDFFAHLSS